MSKNLTSFQDVVRELSDEFNVPYEKTEAILIAWTKIHYKGMLSCSSKDIDVFLNDGYL